MREDRHIPAKDGFNLTASVFESETRSDSVAIISSATATPRTLYDEYAQHLSQLGYHSITYDYRGVGDSRPNDLRGFQARMRDWAELDMSGAMAWALDRYHPSRLIMIGHSVGGQIAGLVEESDRVTAMVTLSAQSGYWGLHPGSEKYKVWFFAYIGFRLLCGLVGYLPWSRFRPGEDLPKGVALEWARWSRSPDYLFGDTSLQSLHNFPMFRAPILAYSFSDDLWGSKRSVDNMMSRYAGSMVTRIHKTPADIRADRIGHLGFFRARTGLWSEVDEWLRTH